MRWIALLLFTASALSAGDIPPDKSKVNTPQTGMVMVATVNRVPVYLRNSQMQSPDAEKMIIRAIEGELIVQCEPSRDVSTGSPSLRSEIERAISRIYPSREVFDAMLESEGMTYEDYVYEQRRQMAWETFAVWIVDYDRLVEHRTAGRKISMEQMQRELTKEERAPAYRKKYWENFLINLKAAATIERLR